MIVLAFAAVWLSQASISTAQPPKIDDGGGSVFSKLNPSNWSVPKAPTFKFPTVSMKKSKTKSTSSGFWNNLGNSTRSTWRKTTEFLNPFDGKPKKTRKSKGSGGGLFGWWSEPKKESEPITTVGDFLQQPFPY